MLEVKNISKKFSGNNFASLDNLSFSVAEGEIFALLGESGCGKTTALRIIAGFEHQDSGHISIAGATVSGNGIYVEPHRRKVGVVFQDYALFPHITVYANIRFGISRLSSAEPEQRAAYLLELTGLGGLGKRYPHELSGGQRQRVAIARALAQQPKLILMDEPFSSIDSALKSSMRKDIRSILEKSGAAAVFVTHDTKDVLAIADNLSLLRNGRCVQHGSPEAIYREPVCGYSANFFGKANIIGASASGHIMPAEVKEPEACGGVYAGMEACIRPADIEIATDGQPGAFCAIVDGITFMGEYYDISCTCVLPDRSSLSLSLHLPELCGASKGGTVWLRVKKGKFRFLSH
jgi:iron(III) transport system ATP-binding protein